MASIPEIPLAKRRELLALPPRAGLHAGLLAELGFADALELAPPPAPAAPARELRVVAWNAQRGTEPARAAALLRATGADAFLLSEVDVGMARTAQAHVPHELAARLGVGFAFAVEFLELGLGDAHERALHAGKENSVGWHGAALLARQPLREPRVARVEPGGRWFDGALGERRIGSRIAVLAKLALLDSRGAAREVALAAIHLESHSDPDERAAQLAAVFDALDRLAPGAPALVGGDANTHSLGRPELEDRAHLRAALAADPSRLADPVAHEPLFALAETRGFAWRSANLPGRSTYKRDGRGALALDWFFARGLEVADPEVIPTGALSDHEGIGLTIRLAPE